MIGNTIGSGSSAGSMGDWICPSNISETRGGRGGEGTSAGGTGAGTGGGIGPVAGAGAGIGAGAGAGGRNGSGVRVGA